MTETLTQKMDVVIHEVLNLDGNVLLVILPLQVFVLIYEEMEKLWILL